MSIFNRNKSNSTIPEDLQPYYTAQQPTWKVWLSRILRIALLLLLLGLLIWGATWAINKFAGKNTAADKPGTSVEQKAADARKQAEQKLAEQKAKNDAAAKAEQAKKEEEARKRAAAGTTAPQTTSGTTATPTPAPTGGTAAPAPQPVLPKTGG